MNDGQNPTQTVPGGFPLPAGTDDNANPYWFIDGRKVFWAEMQQYIAQLQKQKPATTVGGGLEGMSQIVMPNIEAAISAPANPEVGPQIENRLESNRERGLESRENRNERPQQQQQGTQPQPKQATPAAAPVKAPSLVGDSPVLTQVDTSSPASIVSYVDAHHKDAPVNSSRFLSELLGKIVKIFSLEH